MHAPHLCCRPLTVSPPKDDEVIVRVEAAPINPSDLGLLLAAGISIVEHLTGLDQLPPTGARFTAVPLRIEGLGTIPVRALARLPQ